jgi:hypothetical protein
LLVVVVVDHM